MSETSEKTERERLEKRLATGVLVFSVDQLLESLEEYNQARRERAVVPAPVLAFLGMFAHPPAADPAVPDEITRPAVDHLERIQRKRAALVPYLTPGPLQPLRHAEDNLEHARRSLQRDEVVQARGSLIEAAAWITHALDALEGAENQVEPEPPAENLTTGHRVGRPFHAKVAEAIQQPPAMDSATEDCLVAVSKARDKIRQENTILTPYGALRCARSCLDRLAFEGGEMRGELMIHAAAWISLAWETERPQKSKT